MSMNLGAGSSEEPPGPCSAGFGRPVGTGEEKSSPEATVSPSLGLCSSCQARLHISYYYGSRTVSAQLTVEHR